MCFSAPASFTAAASLAILGGLTLKGLENHKHKMLALIPLLFAVQQFCEGVLWLAFPSPLGQAAAYGFLLFALIIWPLYIPLATAYAESTPWRRDLMLVLAGAGLLWSLNTAYYAFTVPIEVALTNNVVYAIETSLYSKLIYGTIVLVPLLVSSIRYLWVFGALVGFSAFMTHYSYTAAYTSVWCFFAALLSALLYFILRANRN